MNSLHEVNLEEGGKDNNVLYPCTKYCRYFTLATLCGADTHIFLIIEKLEN